MQFHTPSHCGRLQALTPKGLDPTTSVGGRGAARLITNAHEFNLRLCYWADSGTRRRVAPGTNRTRPVWMRMEGGAILGGWSRPQAHPRSVRTGR